MNKKQYGIIAIGYNRLDSLERLLNALNQAVYGEEEPLLIISLDYAGVPEIITLAEKFLWKHGRKVIKAYQERQGLRAHILHCGDYLEEYQLDAAAVFEDDILPSPAFFHYMTSTVDFYGESDKIAGISLYTHLWNETYHRPFQPMYSGYDTFFMQYAQSWGQIWLSKQWKEFKTWYLEHNENFREAPGIPSAVAGWKDSSWLKYHIRYCVEKDKYFVYPYESLCTNFTEIGTHNKRKTAMYQVPMQIGVQKEYRFGTLENAPVVYDAFFENKQIARSLGIPEEKLCVDLYGSKPVPSDKEYWLTMRVADYKIERTFGLSLRPHELNVMMGVPGTEIKLYRMTQKQKNIAKELSRHQYFDYYFRLTYSRWKELFCYLWEKVLVRLKK